MALGLGVAVALSAVTVAATTSRAFADAQTTLTESASPTSGRTPLPVTFAYHETNDGTDPISNVQVTSTACPAGATFVSGDTNSNGILDPGETWNFTCSKTLTSSFTDNSSATGTDTIDGLRAPTVDESATASVTVIQTELPILTESASPTSGRSPLSVAFTYNETDVGTDPIGNVMVTTTSCPSGAAYLSGDTNNSGVLDPGETWTFTCTVVLSNPGTYTDTSEATGTDTVDGLPATRGSASASVDVIEPDSDLTFTNVPSDITVDASGPMGAIVNYALPTVVDEDTPTPGVTCDPAPGSTFAIGTATVTCSIAPGNTDEKNSSAPATFTVTVNGAGWQVISLAGRVETLPFVGTSLDAKMQTTTQHLQAGNVHAACNTLTAVINQASAQTGRHLTVDQANQVIAQTEQIAAVLAC